MRWKSEVADEGRLGLSRGAPAPMAVDGQRPGRLVAGLMSRRAAGCRLVGGLGTVDRLAVRRQVEESLLQNESFCSRLSRKISYRPSARPASLDAEGGTPLTS